MFGVGLHRRPSAAGRGRLRTKSRLLRGQSFWPTFFQTSDETVFDAIGWDFPVPAACPDLDGDGSVSTSDLLDLLGQWGSDPGGPPDFNGDGLVATADLLLLLGAWGPCE